MRGTLLIWTGALLIEAALLCGLLELPPVLGVLRWMWILIFAGGVHFVVAHQTLKKGRRLEGREVMAIFAAAVLFRLTVLPTAPALSDDAYRYVWDGRVQNAGINPFRHAPDDPQLAFLRDAAVWPNINHRDLKTIYPPTAQILSALAARAAYLAPTAGGVPLLPWKLVLLALELGGAALLAAGLHSKGRGAAFLIYGWSPLAIVEFYGSGHVDAAGVGLLAAAAGLTLLHRRVASGAAFAASFLTKLVVAPVAIGFFALKGRGRRLLGAGLATVLLTLPYAGSGGSAFESLVVYQAEWQFNGVLHRLLHVDSWAAAPDRIARGAWGDLHREGTTGQKRTGRVIASLLVLGAGAAALLYGARPAAVAIWILGFFLMVQPTIHPWYLTWLLPLLAVQYVRAFLIWTVTIPFTYEALIAERLGTAWVENPYMQVAALLPVLFFVVWDLRKRAAGPGPIPVPQKDEQDKVDGAARISHQDPTAI